MRGHGPEIEKSMRQPVVGLAVAHSSPGLPEELEVASIRFLGPSGSAEGDDIGHHAHDP